MHEADQPQQRQAVADSPRAQLDGDVVARRDAVAHTEKPPFGQASGPSQSRWGSRQAWILTVCCVAQFMVILDLSIVNVALPAIQASLNFNAVDLQWVVDGYAIAFAGFLMLGGRAADHFGQRRLFLAALAFFAIASLFGGVATDREMLIGARIAQGVAGALMAASSLSIITSSFPAGPARHRAIGLWGAMNGAGGAVGTLLGGVLTQELSWRWVLLINPPIGIAAAVIAGAVVADRRREGAAPAFDIGGALTLTGGQIVLVYGIVTGGTQGWNTAAALVPIVVGLVLLAMFGVIERRVSAPLVPFHELTRPLRVANGVVILFSAALFPMWYVSSLYLQQVLGLSPLRAGLVFLPMALMIMVCARRAGAAVSRFGVRAVLGGGLIMMTAGMLLFARIASAGSAIGYVMIPGLLTAAGIALCVVASTIAATQSAKEGQAGLASGLVNTSRQIGGGLGLAILITLATELTSHFVGTGREVPQALTDGFRLAYLIGAGFCAAAALITFTLLPRGAAAGSARRGARFASGVAVAVAALAGLNFLITTFKGAPVGAYTTSGTYSFVSAPTLHPPVISTDKQAAPGQLAPGYIFTANFYDLTTHPMIGQSGPLILDNKLQPVWFKPVPTNVVASNLSLQRYEGKPALAWWQGLVTDTGATESGEDVVVNQHYQTIATLKGKDGWILTLHAMVIRGDDAWVTANKNIPKNLSRYGGTYNGAMTDSAVQEYNLKTGALLRSWDALDHIPLSDSYAIPQTNGFPWDAYHVNSIQLVGNNELLVSMRNTFAVYLVNIDTGKIIWTLGGKHSNFKFGPGADFQWQHDVSLQPNSTLTVFDDHCCQISGAGTFLSATAPSRALILKLNQATHTATLVAQYGHGSNFDADYMGDTEPLSNGNVFVGWGSQPYFSEYSSSGKLLMDASFPGPDLSYRAMLEPWTGAPLYPPAVAARVKHGKTLVYASWNGATQVASWKVWAQTSTGRLALVAWYDKSGFETAMPVPRGYTTFEVQALNSRRQVIGASKRFHVARS